MPTARPIISASSGAVLETVVNAETEMMPPITTPTPIRADSNGIPAGRSAPKVMSSTIPANSTPKISVGVMPKVWSWKT